MSTSPCNYSDPRDVPRKICLTLAATLRHPLYRAAQFISLIESIATVVCILYVFLKCRRNFVVHQNVKVLLCALFISCISHAIVYSISKTYQLSVSFFVVDECQMFLPRMFYIITHLLILFTNCCMQNMQICLTVERIVATVYVDSYETYCTPLGSILVIILVLVTTAEVGFGYEQTIADILMTNSLIHHDKETNALVITFVIIFIICCVTLLVTIVLYYYNSHRRKRSTLSSRYQVAENVSMAALLCLISVIQLVTFAIYALSMTYLKLALVEDPLLDAYKELAYLVPLNTLLLPVATIIFVGTQKRSRQEGLAALLNLKTRGPQGWQNCSEALKHQWR